MKNKRQESKEQTFNRIVEVTRQLVNQRGILLLNTMDIAKVAEIAHGTVFAHFASKEKLISFICQYELKRIAIKLKELIENEQSTIPEILESYISLLAEDEDFFVVIAKEFPFLSSELQQSIILTESIVANILYQNIERGIKEGIYKNIDITTSLSFLTGALNFYLSRKEYFISSNKKVLIEKKQNLIDTFLEILKP